MTTSSDPSLLALHCGNLHALVAPALGGSLASLYSINSKNGVYRDWLRAAPNGGQGEHSPLAMASFPLLPWANRIRGAKFLFAGQSVRLKPRQLTGDHALHGLGWLHSWSVSSASDSHVSLCMRWVGTDDWPFEFTALQTYSLDNKGLTIELALTNQGDGPMPADLGHHPYFPHDRSGRGTRITAQVDGMWETDADVLPTVWNQHHAAVQALQTEMDLRHFALDNNFTGFEGEARVVWPDGSRLTMRSTAPMRYFVVYSPRDEDFFCMEPVSNCTDWLNYPGQDHSHSGADCGGHVLSAGQTLAGTICFDIHASGEAS
jgi:aldose 1-epimerase